MMLLKALLFLPLLQGQLPGGVVTGVVRDVYGKPQPDVRVAAVALPEQAAGADVMVAISRTDPDGRYRLEVPPGRFFIAAGRVEMPTYYPGFLDRSAATAVPVQPGLSTSGVDVIAAAESLAGPTPSSLAIRRVVFPTNPVPPATPPRPPTNLLPFLLGNPASQNARLIFEFLGFTGRAANFRTASGSFSYGCSGCSFFVRDGGVGPQTNDPGMLFTTGPNGQSLDFTCLASLCHLAQVASGSVSVSQLSRNQTGTVNSTDQVAFAIIP